MPCASATLLACTSAKTSEADQGDLSVLKPKAKKRWNCGGLLLGSDSQFPAMDLAKFPIQKASVLYFFVLFSVINAGDSCAVLCTARAASRSESIPPLPSLQPSLLVAFSCTVMRYYCFHLQHPLLRMLHISLLESPGLLRRSLGSVLQSVSTFAAQVNRPDYNFSPAAQAPRCKIQAALNRLKDPLSKMATWTPLPSVTLGKQQPLFEQQNLFVARRLHSPAPLTSNSYPRSQPFQKFSHD